MTVVVPVVVTALRDSRLVTQTFSKSAPHFIDLYLLCNVTIEPALWEKPLYLLIFTTM